MAPLRGKHAELVPKSNFSYGGSQNDTIGIAPFHKDFQDWKKSRELRINAKLVNRLPPLDFAKSTPDKEKRLRRRSWGISNK